MAAPETAAGSSRPAHPSQRPRPAPPQPQSLPRRLLSLYLNRLKTKPLSTKMVTSALLFFAGDSIAQFGIEGRSLPFSSRRDPAAVEEEAAVNELRQLEGARTGGVVGAEDDTKWDPYRAARLIFYGGTIFAPLAHNWLNLLQRVQLSTKFRSESSFFAPLPLPFPSRCAALPDNLHAPPCSVYGLATLTSSNRDARLPRPSPVGTLRRRSLLVHERHP